MSRCRDVDLDEMQSEKRGGEKAAVSFGLGKRWWFAPSVFCGVARTVLRRTGQVRPCSAVRQGGWGWNGKGAAGRSCHALDQARAGTRARRVEQPLFHPRVVARLIENARAFCGRLWRIYLQPQWARCALQASAIGAGCTCLAQLAFAGQTCLVPSPVSGQLARAN